MLGSRLARRLTPLAALLVAALACGPPAEAATPEAPAPIALDAAYETLAPDGALGVVPADHTCMEIIVPRVEPTVLLSFYPPGPTCADRGAAAVTWRADSPHRWCDVRGVTDLTTGKMALYAGNCRDSPSARSGGT